MTGLLIAGAFLLGCVVGGRLHHSTRRWENRIRREYDACDCCDGTGENPMPGEREARSDG